MPLPLVEDQRGSLMRLTRRVVALSVVIVLCFFVHGSGRAWAVVVCAVVALTIGLWYRHQLKAGRTRLSDNEVERKWRDYSLRGHTLPACSGENGRSNETQQMHMICTWRPDVYKFPAAIRRLL